MKVEFNDDDPSDSDIDRTVHSKSENIPSVNVRKHKIIIIKVEHLSAKPKILKI